MHINIWGVHHDAAHWPEPESFRPERFLGGAEGAAERHPNAFLGFGIGAPHPLLSGLLKPPIMVPPRLMLLHCIRARIALALDT